MNIKVVSVSSLFSCILCLNVAVADSLQIQEKRASLEATFNRAEWVSTVKIEDVRSLVNQAMSQTKSFFAVQGYRYSASVVQDWKGPYGAEEILKFRVDLSDCRDQLVVDNEYIVFGTSNYRDSLQVLSCDDLVSSENMKPLMDPLKELSKSHRENTK